MGRISRCHHEVGQRIPDAPVAGGVRPPGPFSVRLWETAELSRQHLGYDQLNSLPASPIELWPEPQFSHTSYPKRKCFGVHIFPSFHGTTERAQASQPLDHASEESDHSTEKRMKHPNKLTGPPHHTSMVSPTQREETTAWTSPPAYSGEEKANASNCPDHLKNYSTTA